MRTTKLLTENVKLHYQTGFDNARYLKAQTQKILERVNLFNNKLYLEFGGKLLYDLHASRVLPGFDSNVKIKLLQTLKEKADIILCIYAGDIERRKVRADFGITYDADALKLIDDLRERGINVCAVVITRFQEQPAALIFKNKLMRRGIKVYIHRYTKGYPTEIETIVSDQGYGANEYIETEKPLVIVTGPGPGSGKLATCLSQLYHSSKRKIKAGYAKFETFPIWNLALHHPVNIAYEAATADLGDRNMIDSFHLEAYQKTAINYNRDLEIFPVLKRILEKITNDKSIYKSPTDMGVNCAKEGILNDDVVQFAAKQEIIRRYFRCCCEYAMGLVNKNSVQRIELIMKELNLEDKDRLTVMPARELLTTASAAAAIQLKDRSIVTGKSSSMFHAPSSAIINAIKRIAAIPDKIHLLSENILESVISMKKDILNKKEICLDVEETLIALAISATTNTAVGFALDKLKELFDCDMHITHIPSPGDEAGLRQLGINVTSDPLFLTKDLFVK